MDVFDESKNYRKYCELMNEYSLKGHLWQGRFYSCVLDEEHLYRAIRCVEKNPVRAEIVKEAWGYKWSSARQQVFSAFYIERQKNA